MNWSDRDPTLEEMLSDPIIKALMEADRVDPRELETILRRVERSRRDRPEPRPRPGQFRRPAVTSSF